MGSLTIFSTLELQFLLRTFNILGITLVALWALSPLGGQASLRLLATEQQPSSSTQNVSYMNADAMPIFSEGADIVSELGFLTNALYLSALFTAPIGQASDVDTWGKVKIPKIEPLESTSDGDAEGWYDVTPGNKAYSSLVGLPIDGTSWNGLYHFQVESLYMNLNCPDVSSPAEGSHPGGFAVDIEGINGPLLLPNQTSYPEIKIPRVGFSASTMLTERHFFIANCTMLRSSVESNITCDHGACRVTRIRRSDFDKRPSGYTPFHYWPSAVTIGNFQTSWSGSGGTQHPGSSTPTEYFISDPTMRSLTTEIDQGGILLANLPTNLFSERFSLVFNSYYQLGLVPWYQTGNFPTDGTSAGINDTIGGDLYYHGRFNTTTSTVTTFTEIYVCNKIWAAILFFASTILLVCGLGGAIINHMMRGPKILGYVSTMTRDNPYLNLPSGGCTLDGLERARLLRNLEVKVQDVAAESQVGHIALSSASIADGAKLVFIRRYAGTAHGSL